MYDLNTLEIKTRKTSTNRR